jgi:hypothetical protein
MPRNGPWRQESDADSGRQMIANCHASVLQVTNDHLETKK